MRITRPLLVTALAFSCLFFLHSPSFGEDAQVTRARQILETVDDLWRGKSSKGRMTMKVKTANYSRSLTMDYWSKGKEMSLIRIVDPLKEKDTATLKSGDTIYTYLPKTDRTIKLTSGMMMGSWMGSHFTNDDLVKESRLSEDYTPAVTFEGERGGKQVIDFTLMPHETAAVVWGKIELTVLADGFIPVNETYYNEDMEVVRTMTFSGIREMGGRTLASVMRVTPHDKPGEYTELIYESIAFNLPFDETVFSVNALRRR